MQLHRFKTQILPKMPVNPDEGQKARYIVQTVVIRIKLNMAGFQVSELRRRSRCSSSV